MTADLTIAPVVQVEVVQNTNMKVELSKNAEIIAALHSFLVQYSSHEFKISAMDVLGGLFDGIHTFTYIHLFLFSN